MVGRCRDEEEESQRTSSGEEASMSWSTTMATGRGNYSRAEPPHMHRDDPSVARSSPPLLLRMLTMQSSALFRPPPRDSLKPAVSGDCRRALVRAPTSCSCPRVGLSPTRRTAVWSSIRAPRPELRSEPDPPTTAQTPQSMPHTGSCKSLSTICSHATINEITIAVVEPLDDTRHSSQSSAFVTNMVAVSRMTNLGL